MSKFSMRRSKKGFTLIEIMIVVLIIAVLLAIAIPNFMKARETSRTKACVANLRQIDTAKVQWAMDQKKVGTDVPATTDLYPTYVKAAPSCPSGGTYTIGAVDTNPSCSIGGSHTL